MKQRTHQIKRLTLRLPNSLHGRLSKAAEQQGRSLNKMAVTALKVYLDEEMDGEMTKLPEEKELGIIAKDVELDRKIIAEHEARIKIFEAKAATSTGSRRGAYEGHITKAKRSLDAMSGNLAYHLDWLKRFSPEVYKEVTSEEVTS